MASPILREPHSIQSRRFVSFAEEDVMNSTEAFAAKFGEGELGMESHADMNGTSTPAWLLADGAAATGSTDDVMDEFLTDDDMLRLEVECLKWYDLSDKDLKAIAKLDSKMAQRLLDCHKDISTFLRYRQQLNEKHARKASVKVNMRRKTIGEDTIEEEGEEDEEEDDELKASGAAASKEKETQRTKSGSEQMSAKAKGRKSVVANPRRKSVSAALARAGTQISGTSEDASESPNSSVSARSGRRPTIAVDAINSSSNSEPSAAMKGRKSLFGKASLPRRMSLAANKAAQIEVAESSGGDTGRSAGKKGPADFRSNQSQGSESSGAGERSRMSRQLTRKLG